MNILQAREMVLNRPLLLSPAYAEVLVSVFADRLDVEPLVSDEIAQRYVRPANSATFDASTGIAVLPIVGSMVHRGGGMESLSGVQSYTELHGKLTALIGNDKVRGILIDMDTPGGSAAGITELGDWIKLAKAEKPIWAIANTSMTSGGYWLASAASRIIAAPMASIGSIGVVVMHTDVSKAMEKRGVVHTFIHAGAHKVEGNPYEPLPEGVRLKIQSSVDSLYGQFVATVASNRGLNVEAIRQTEAGIFDPQQSLEMGLVDGIGGLGETLTSFAAELNRKTTWSVSRGRYMDKEYTKDDLGHAVRVAVDEHKAALSGEVSGVIRATFSGKRAEAFCAALDKGASLSLSGDLARMIDEPKAEAAKAEPEAAKKGVAALDALMSSQSPNVSADDSASAMSADDKRAARMAEITGAAKHVRAQRGYGAAR